MAKRIGFGDYQYEVVEHWPQVESRGTVADVCVDARGRVYAGVLSTRIGLAEASRFSSEWRDSGEGMRKGSMSVYVLQTALH